MVLALVSQNWNTIVLELKKWWELGKQVREPIILS